MKTLKFDIPIYNIQVDLLQIESKKDLRNVHTIMRSINCEQSFLDDVESNIKDGCFDGGEIYRNLFLRKMLVIFYPMSDDETRAEVYSHEKRHIEDRILEHFSVDDIESAALLAGYLARKFYHFWKIVKKGKE